MHKHREEQEQTSSSNPQELRFSAGDKVTLGDKSGKVYWIIRQSLAVQLLRWATAINWQHRFNWLRGVQSKQFSITRCERFKTQSSFDMACGCNSALLSVSVLSRGREGKSDKHLMPSTVAIDVLGYQWNQSVGGWNLNQKLIEVLRAACSDIIPLLFFQPADPISGARSFSPSLNPLRFDFGQLIKYA